MDRRRFLLSGVASAASAASLLAASGCAPAMKLSQPRRGVAPDDIEGYLGRVDSGLAYLGRWSSANYAPLVTAHAPETDALGRAALQSLYLVGMVGDLTIEKQAHPGVQERLERAMPTFDTAIDGMTTFLRSRGSEDLAVVQVALRDHDGGTRIIERIDTEAASIGLSEWRREQTRSIFANAEWRLRNQPPGLLVSEYLDKIDRVNAADVRAEAATQALAARVAEEAFWQVNDPRRRRISRGAKIMGVGLLIVAGGGLILAGGSDGGVFIMSVGAVTMIVGLVILLVGLATRPAPRVPADTTGARQG